MANLTLPFDVQHKVGDEVSIALSNVKCYRGGAAAVVLGTGYATPLVIATAGMSFRGVFEATVDNSAGSAGDKYVSIATRGLFPFHQTGLVQADIGKKVYFSDDNTVTLTPGAIYAGDIETVDDYAGLAWVRIDNAVETQAFNKVQIAAGTALTASSTETLLGSYSIPAKTLKAGDRIRIRAQGTATATNASDTLTVKAYIGGLTGTALCTTPNPDATNGDVFYIDAEITIRTSGGTGTLVACGVCANGAPGTATALPFFLASTAVDTTAAQVVGVSGTWSSTNAGNSCRLDILSVEVIRS